MLEAMEADPTAASLAPRPISCVAAVCSSTAAAIATWFSVTRSMVLVISVMAAAASSEPSWMSRTDWLTRPVARAVSAASDLTSPATTVKPSPASPARAASMVALRASRWVCPAMDWISSTTRSTRWDDSPSAETDALARTAWLDASTATRDASDACTATSRIVAPSCSVAAATTCTLFDTWTAAVAAASAMAAVPSAVDDIRLLISRT